MPSERNTQPTRMRISTMAFAARSLQADDESFVMPRLSRSLSAVIEQRHETKVHVQLLMAMEQREAGIIRREIHFDFLIAAHHDHVFHHPGARYSSNLGKLKTVTVQMDGMDIVAGVAHPQAVTLPQFQMK